jgi:hypothetical protein
MTPATMAVDLRRHPLTSLRAIDFRAPDRDFWDDEAAIRDRLIAAWAGLDLAAWSLPGVAPSDAGGPDWSLAEHVGHIVDWQEIATGYIERVLNGAAWPSDDEYDGGDFDRFNERRREPWASMPVEMLLDRLHRARVAVLDRARRVPLGTIRSDEVWGWVYMVLHGHAIDHLTVIEPWTDRLRGRQVEGDPFVADPRPAGDGSPAAVAAFWLAEQGVFSQFDDLVRPISFDRWEEPGPTPDWTLKDHVAHLARWFEEGADVIHEHQRSGRWRHSLTDGLDAWNAREVEAARSMSPDEALRRFDAGHVRLAAAARAMPGRELASPEAGEWVYECLHGHVRSHLAMIGPWTARLAWPTPADDTLEEIP